MMKFTTAINAKSNMSQKEMSVANNAATLWFLGIFDMSLNQRRSKGGGSSMEKGHKPKRARRYPLLSKRQQQ
jgi:hypothetical protein